MARCKTRWYVTSNKDDIERLARIDNTPKEKIQCKDGVEPLCVENFWSYWSDGEFTEKTFSGDRPPNNACPISESARAMIDNAAGSDSGFPSKNILDTLVKAIDVKESKIHRAGGTGLYYAGRRVIEYDVELPGGKDEKLYASTMGYPEGYMFKIERTLAGAMKQLEW